MNLFTGGERVLRAQRSSHESRQGFAVSEFYL